MRDQEENAWLRKITSAGEFKTPYMLTDLSMVRKQALDLKKQLPRASIYYALKSNSDPEIIKELDTIVDGFDIASLGEYKVLKKLNINSNRVVYSNPVKVPDHIDETYREGVRFFALDSLTEIEKLKKYAPGSTVYLRLKVPDYGSKFPLSTKFGINPIHVIPFAEAVQDAGLNLKGLTFHVGSQSENPRAWDAAIKMLGELVDALKKIGVDIEFLNLGGGLPATYEDVASTADDALKVINEALDSYISKDIRIMIEPGRFFSANSSVLVGSVIGREHRSGTDWLYLDMGVFQGLIEPLEVPGWKYPIFSRKHKKGYRKSFVLTGPTCDAHDTIGNYSLPSDLMVGDQLYIGATGAYSLVYGSEFNGFQIPHVHHINKGPRHDH